MFDRFGLLLFWLLALSACVAIWYALLPVLAEFVSVVIRESVRGFQLLKECI